MASQCGSFCLEGDWYGLKDRTTVEPVLQLLERSRKVPYIHRDIGTREEFDYYLSKWTQKGYGGYSILYLAKVSTTLDHIDSGHMALPEFQRGYVWNRDQVRALMQSLYRRHPVGSLPDTQTGHRGNRFRSQGRSAATLGFGAGL